MASLARWPASSRSYRLDLGHNFVLADARCNGFKSDRLASVDHLERWHARNSSGDWSALLTEHAMPVDQELTRRVALWAYGQAARTGSTVWSQGRDGMVSLDDSWERLLAS